MKKNILLLIIGVFLLIITFMALKYFCPECFNIEFFKPEKVQHFIRSFGPWAIIVYILLYIVNTFSPFFPPIFIMSLAAGAVFGPVWGTVALTLGTTLGTSAVFMTSRYLGGKWVENLVQGNEKSSVFYNQLSNSGFFILLGARLVGFPPYGIIDAICGLSKMKYLDFFLATFLGGVPWIIAQVLLADRLVNFNPKDPVLWIVLVVFIAMIMITSKIVKKRQEQDIVSGEKINE